MSTDERFPDSAQDVGAVARIFVASILTGHFAVAAGYWWLSPKGFPVDHARFWLNSVVPIAVGAMLALSLVEGCRRRYSVAFLCLVICAAGWMAVAVSSCVLFPVSLGKLWVAALFPAGFVAAAVIILRRVVHIPLWASFCAACTGAGLGVFAVWAQMPPIPDTKPAAKLAARGPNSDASATVPSRVEFGAGASFAPASAALSVDCGRVKIRCYPLLEFDRISPDGFWSLLAPPNRLIRAAESCTGGASEWFCRYSDGSSIRILAPDTERYVHLDATTVVEADSYSHLNSFCVFQISGHKQLSLGFSPCPESIIEVLPADYPVGRPARFAYADRADAFRIVEATSGEKGPFSQLASGPLRSGEAIKIHLYDGGQQVATIRLEDWTSQLSTTLSPTAGWGVPVNAIEFQRLGSSEESDVQIWISLAATSVGRGWECVGHREGVYRNRVMIESGGF